MIDFTGLLLPLIVAASLISGVAVTDPQSLYIDAITVPSSMQSRGYTPVVFVRMMNDELLGIEATAKTRNDAQKLRTEDEKGVIAVTLDMLNMTTLVRAVQESSNLIEFTVNGEIVEVGKNYLLRLRVDRYGRQVTRIEVTKPQTGVHELAVGAAEQIMKLTDPQVYCASIMQIEARTLDPAGGSYLFPKTDSCIKETLPTAQEDDRLWLLNLQGVVAFVEGRLPDAAKHFRAAIRGNPDFSPALLNLGILWARSGKPEKAIGYFKSVFRHEIPSDSPQTFAAAYTEWADALAASGHGAEADAMFRRATQVDPKYAEAYFRWARHTADPKKAQQLTARGQALAQTYGGLYTENLIGKLRITAAEMDQSAAAQQLDEVEGTLGDVGLLAEPRGDHSLWDYLRSTWYAVRGKGDAAAALGRM
jgi:tetratricopeptide (TPR) repeat protein